MEYGCIGEHLAHSFSKEIHNDLADYQYGLKELAPEELADFFAKRSFKSINVTIPYKKDVIPFLDYISDEAKEINAVNTIVNKEGRLYGYNTDFYGLKSLIERENVSLKGKKVAILGSGGTSNTAFAVAKSLDSSKILRVSRSEKVGYITYDQLYKEENDCDVVINTTPCGMYPKLGVAAVDLNKLPFVEAVFDAVYNPLKSKLVLDAEAKGLKAVGGLYMLVSQAAFAVEKFIDMPVDDEKIEIIFQKLCKSKMNIVLIGMPASGKSTVGKCLAERTGKSFVDSDEKIVEAEGKEIPLIFSEKGEYFFRQLEVEAISSISLENTRVIATGGGAVLNPRNIENLKANGRVYFIDRPIEMLVATEDRPLSSNRADLEKRFNERYELYKNAADVIIDGSGSIENVVERIEAEFNGYSCD